MTTYVLRRILGWLVMIVLATNLTYFLASSFLDPRANYLAQLPPPPDYVIDNNLDRYNLNSNEPILSRWWDWITGIATQWNWGTSPEGVLVNDEVSFRIWVSAQLVLGATIISTVLGIALGVFTASRQYRASDRIWQQISPSGPWRKGDP